MNLQQVKPPFVLTIPESMWASSETNVRAKAGDIIDLDVPGEAELCRGQMHKFQPAPEGSVPTPSAVKLPRVAMFLRDAAKAAPAAAPAPAAQELAPEAKPKAGPVPRAPVRPAGNPGQSNLPTVDALPNVPAPAKG